MNFLSCYLNHHLFIKHLFSNVNGILGISLYVTLMVMLQRTAAVFHYRASQISVVKNATRAVFN